MPRPARPWFRFYTEVLNDPKVLRLTDRQYRVWTMLLCVAAICDGEIKKWDASLLLRMPVKNVLSDLRALIDAGLIEVVDEDTLTPHNWKGRQYESDVSTSRVQRFRKQERNVSVTADETPPETEAETEQRQSRAETETDTDARAPSHPFAFAYAKKFQAKNAGRPPPPTQHAEAVALEDEHGADWCFRAAEAFDWQKQPSYLRPWIIDHKGRSSGNTNGTNSSEPAASGGAGGLAPGLGGVDERIASIAERRRHRTV